MSSLKVTIVRIVDGDTIVVKEENSKEFTSRARWIDCPETAKGKTSEDPQLLDHWKWGEEAKKKSIELMPVGSTLTIVNHGKDQYGRTLSDWYKSRVIPSQNIQAQIAKEGFAVYSIYNEFDLSEPDIKLFTLILKNVAAAFQAKLGMWQSPNLMLPSQVKRIT